MLLVSRGLGELIWARHSTQSQNPQEVLPQRVLQQTGHSSLTYKPSDYNASEEGESGSASHIQSQLIWCPVLLSRPFPLRKLYYQYCLQFLNSVSSHNRYVSRLWMARW